jgi:hypothetical protein
LGGVIELDSNLTEAVAIFSKKFWKNDGARVRNSRKGAKLAMKNTGLDSAERRSALVGLEEEEEETLINANLR